MVLGRITKTFFIGDQKITDSSEYLKETIQRYSQTLGTIQVSLNLRICEVLSGNSLQNLG
jgi:hypothetical protein